MTRLESINSRGLYAGWHALELQERAYSNKQSMAKQWQSEIKDVPIAAFNVPGKAIKANSSFVTYEFLDGSTVRVPV